MVRLTPRSGAVHKTRAAGDKVSSFDFQCAITALKQRTLSDSDTVHPIVVMCERYVRLRATNQAGGLASGRVPRQDKKRKSIPGINTVSIKIQHVSETSLLIG